MKYTLLLLVLANSVFAQFHQLSGSSGSVAGSAVSPTLGSTVLVGQAVVGDASGGAFGTRGGMISIFEETIIALDVPEEDATLPTEYVFAQNFPNPFNPSTTFEFSLPKAGLASLQIYDELGRAAGKIFEREIPAGTFAIQFQAPMDWSSGVYFAVFKAGDFQQVRKIVLMK